MTKGNDDSNLLGEAETLRLSGTFSEAVSKFDAVIARRGETAWSLAHRGSAKIGMGDLTGAIADLASAIELREGYAWALSQKGEAHRLRARDSLAPSLQQLLAEPGFSWDAPTADGFLPEHVEDLGLSLEAFGASIAKTPRNAWALAHRGASHTFVYWLESLVNLELVGPAQDHLAKARADLEAATEINPTYAWAHAFLAVLETLEGNCCKATETAGVARLYDINNRLLVLRALTEVNTIGGQNEDALTTGWLSLQKNPEDVFSRYWVNNALYQSSSPLADNAAEYTRGRLKGTLSMTWEMLGGLDAVSGNVEGARQALREIAKHPDMETLAILARDPAWESMRNDPLYTLLIPNPPPKPETGA